MFEAAGIDAFTALAVIYASMILSFISALVHLLWQVALRTVRIGWRGVFVSSGALLLLFAGLLLAVDGANAVHDWPILLFFVGAILTGAALGRIAGSLVRAMSNKAFKRGYR